MEHPFIDHLVKMARRKNARVAIPDAQFDARVLTAGCQVHQKGWLQVVLTGSRRKLEALARENGLNLTGMKIIDPDETDSFGSMCREYAQLRAKDKLTFEQIDALLRDPVYFACMLLHRGMIEGVCSGVHYSTAQLGGASIRVLGMKEGFRRMTALAIVVFPHTPLGDNLVFACADGTILPRPTSEELAEIAILSADKAKTILPESPRVAMLSFSTLGSAKHEEVDRVVKALQIVRKRRPDICIDGEFQIDAAISPYVAQKKVNRPSEVAGRANVLIWPDLQTGNVAGKGMLLMGPGALIGATFLGINGYVNDHSRGATVEEIVNNIAFVGAQVERAGS